MVYTVVVVRGGNGVQRETSDPATNKDLARPESSHDSMSAMRFSRCRGDRYSMPTCAHGFFQPALDRGVSKQPWSPRASALPPAPCTELPTVVLKPPLDDLFRGGFNRNSSILT